VEGKVGLDASTRWPPRRADSRVKERGAGVRGRWLVATVAALGALAGCAESGSSGPAQTTPSGDASQPSASSSSPAGPAPGGTELTILVDDGHGSRTTWRLTCDPPGGNHPDAAAACQALAKNGERALPPVAKNLSCTQVYGGDQKATVTGSWRGKSVNSSFSLINGCEIGRWKALVGLLPAPRA
jgi:subtilisin inhibitor-like